jgi:hypothetical protein
VTLAERMVAAFLAYGPMAECHLATTVGARKADVSAELECNPMFVHNGAKARASLWDVRRNLANALASFDETVVFPPDYDEVEESLLRLVRQRREYPEKVLLAAVCVMNGVAA